MFCMTPKLHAEEYSEDFAENIQTFSELEDPRSGKNKRHYFGEIIFKALACIVCQVEGFDGMERFTSLKEKWFRRFLKLPNGAPSDDILRRIFTAINLKDFNQYFIKLVREINGDLGAQLIVIDGKALRHSFDRKAGSKCLHSLSVYACEGGLSLDQLAVDTKSNEITAVPELIDLLDLECHTVSLGAMGCRKVIAQKLYLAKAGYLLALKCNQGSLGRRVQEVFNDGEFIKN